MEREIKFKAKCLASHSWVEGDLLHKDGRTYIRKDKVVLADVDHSTVCQFTGLKDCEGKEVWEGDIIEGNRKAEIFLPKEPSLFAQLTIMVKKHFILCLIMLNGMEN